MKRPAPPNVRNRNVREETGWKRGVDQRVGKISVHKPGENGALENP